jgi:hypothetical protein
VRPFQIRPFPHSSIQATLLGRARRVERKGRRLEQRKGEVQFSKHREQEIKNKGCGYFCIFGAEISKLSTEISITKIKNKNKISRDPKSCMGGRARRSKKEIVSGSVQKDRRYKNKNNNNWERHKVLHGRESTKE